MLKRTETTGAHWGAVCALSLSVVVLIMGEMLPASLLTTMAKDLGVSEGVAGQAVTSTSLVALFSSLLIATATRGIDRRRVLLALAALLAISNLVVSVANSFAMLLVGRVLLGLGLGGFWSMAAAVSIRLVPASAGPRALSIVFGGISVGLALGIPLGTYSADIVGWRGIFLGTAILGLVAFLWQLIALPSVPPNGQSRLGTLVELVKRPHLTFGNLAAFLIYCGHFCFFTYLRPFLEGVSGLYENGIAVTLLCFGFANIAGTALSSSMIRAGLRRTLIAMPLLMALLALGMVTWGAFPIVTMIGVACWGCAFGVVPVSWTTWLVRAVPDEIESANGLRIASIQLAISVGAGVGGVLLDAFGPRIPFLGAGVVALLATALIWFKVRPQENQR